MNLLRSPDYPLNYNIGYRTPLNSQNGINHPHTLCGGGFPWWPPPVSLSSLYFLFISLPRRCPPPLPAIPCCRSGPPLDLRRRAQVLARRPEARAAGGTGGGGRGRRGGLGPAWLKEVLAAGGAKSPRLTAPAPPAATRAPHRKEFDGGRSSDDQRQ